MADEPLLILGVSVRAAAMSAVRAGLRPYAIDLFADRDLDRLCPTVRVDPADYPRGLFAAARSAPPGPWMYTGGLENFPELIDALAAERPLWGNPGAVLRRVRDPFAVAAALTSARRPVPKVRAAPDGLPADGSWLLKPLRGGGGRGICPWRGGDVPPEPHYLQRRIDGIPHSAVFCGNGREVFLLGVTRQLVGERRLHAGPFAWCGNVGPLRPRRGPWEGFLRAGRALAAAFGLRGLFGIDAIVDPAGRVWPVEVNPRYTGSVELIERGSLLALMELHRIGCESDPEDTWAVPARLLPRDEVVECGKAVLYAERTVTVPDTDDWLPPPDAGFPARADIPHPGETIPAGMPIATVMVRGTAGRNVTDDLFAAAAELERDRSAVAAGGPA